MSIFFVLAFLIIPLLMTSAAKYKVVHAGFSVLALLCFYIAGSIAGIAVYENNAHDTMFTTDVHHIFLNPWFLCTSAYLALYMAYILMRHVKACIE